MNTYTIKRDGQPPLRFTGKCIASGDNRIQGGNHANRWTQISIYRTKGGKIVIEVERLTQWQGEQDRTAATSVTTAAEAIDWLREDNGGELGGVAQEALDKAAKIDPEFAAAYVEEIE